MGANRHTIRKFASIERRIDPVSILNLNTSKLRSSDFTVNLRTSNFNIKKTHTSYLSSSRQ
nr:MAG TPA: hypothetical protein [Caudoviricetes sp.]